MSKKTIKRISILLIALSIIMGILSMFINNIVYLKIMLCIVLIDFILEQIGTVIRFK